MICQKCGISLPSGTEYCPNCGDKQNVNIINNDEKIIYKMNQKVGWIDKIQAGDIFGRSFGAVLSDKRIYYSGKSYSKNGKNLEKLYEKRTIDLQDVTSTGFYSIKNVTLEIWTLLMLVCSVGCFAFSITKNESAFAFLGGWLLFFTIILFLIYFYSINIYYQITYGGGNLVIQVSQFSRGIKMVMAFDEELRKAKDNAFN